MAKPPERPRKPRKRGLAPEDEALWQWVTREATPLDPARRNASEASDEPVPVSPPELPRPASRPASPPADPETTAPTAALPQARRLRPTGSGAPPVTGFDLVDRAVAPVGRPEAGLDRRNADRLRKGEREPDRRIDLHGLTAERAHRALDRAIAGALASGARLVLVITGKGGKRRDPHAAPFMRDDQGVLRQQVPIWLRSGPHARQIVGVYQAHIRHGGAGALYVYLKKRR